MTATVLSWIVLAISKAGYAGVIALMAVESACIPLPSEIIMPFSGYLASTGRFNLLAAATAGAIGCNVGSTAAYLIGSYGGRPGVLRWGHYLLFGHRELDRIDAFFKRYGSATVFIGRLLPVVRTFISLPAGIARMPFIRFQVYTFVGSWPWCLGLAYVGFKLGEQWDKNDALQQAFHRADLGIALLVVVGVGFYVFKRWRRASK
jgi:membrane protein DedA with SNARE-associated domain